MDSGLNELIVLGECSTPYSGVIDFQGVAELIDAVAGANPKQLSRLLQVLFSSDDRLEARVVIELALRCRDPLAPLESVCRDALNAASDLDRLLRADGWQRVDEVCPNARANALLNLCDEVLSAARREYKRNRRQRCRAIRPRVKVAAVEESNAASETIEHMAAMRKVRCPDFWELFRQYLVRDRADGRLRVAALRRGSHASDS